jgi:hypothetical protein
VKLVKGYSQSPIGTVGGRWLATGSLIVALHLLPLNKARAQNHADYRYELYKEENGRIEVQTHSALTELELKSWLSLKAEVIYDAISGATPTGALPAAGTHKVPTVEIDDDRYAGVIEVGMKYRNITFRPQYAYSDESDYRSISAGLNASIDLNQKNTTMNLGVSHNWDTIIPTEGTFLTTEETRDTTDLLVGLTQLLGPKMFLTANFTYGFGTGYFSDPYKGVQFTGYPDPATVFPENRPSRRDKEIIYLALTRAFDPLHGSAELSYRLYHDSFGIDAHTLGFTWLQKLGSKVVLAPTFRFYNQSAADFYAPSFPGDLSVSSAGIPRHYSSDYRMSDFHAFTYGVSLLWRIHEHVHLDLSYKRYEMIGNDGGTPDDAYPVANVFGAGIRVWF